MCNVMSAKLNNVAICLAMKAMWVRSYIVQCQEIFCCIIYSHSSCGKYSFFLFQWWLMTFIWSAWRLLLQVMMQSWLHWCSQWLFDDYSLKWWWYFCDSFLSVGRGWWPWMKINVCNEMCLLAIIQILWSRNVGNLSNQCINVNI